MKKAKLKTVEAPNLVLAKPTIGLKLDLGAGQNVREGFEGVDLYADVPHKLDILKFPWPFEANSCDELHCSHFVEHIPSREVEERDLQQSHSSFDATRIREKFLGKDMFFAFFEECYRILKPDMWMTVIVPSLQSSRAFQDPTHRRFIPMATFFYLSEEWRKIQKLDHYNVKCNFGIDANFSFPKEMELLHPEAQARRWNESWNTTFDITAKLKALKPAQ